MTSLFHHAFPESFYLVQSFETIEAGKALGEMYWQALADNYLAGVGTFEAFAYWPWTGNDKDLNSWQAQVEDTFVSLAEVRIVVALASGEDQHVVARDMAGGLAG